jgi:hypothetical protein
MEAIVRVLIIGINHQVQSNKICSSSTSGKLERFEQDQKDRFRELLREKIAEHGIQLVAEEANHGFESIAETLCKATTIRYFNIEMKPEERDRRRIPPGYQDEGSTVSEEEKRRGNVEREEYMVQELLTAVGEAHSVLVICGRFHTAGIVSRLEPLGHIVEVQDILDQSWYVEDWQTQMMRL